jgi:hypothetical protein
VRRSKIAREINFRLSGAEMNLYETAEWEEADAPRRNDPRLADAWIRAAAYAAGDDPDAVLAGIESPQSEPDLVG